MSDQALVGYYAKIADTCEQGYAVPERQEDLTSMRDRVVEAVQGHRVLELACGTGYWTAHLVTSAESVLATDINVAMLDLAKARGLPNDKVQFALTDAFDIQVDGDFSACFIGFFWSHIKREEQSRFLARLQERLGANALLVMVDEDYVEGSSIPVARTDLEGNTYQIQTLPDGTRMEVLKNFPSDSALRKKLGAVVKDIRILRSNHYWMATGRFK